MVKYEMGKEGLSNHPAETRFRQLTNPFRRVLASAVFACSLAGCGSQPDKQSLGIMPEPSPVSVGSVPMYTVTPTVEPLQNEALLLPVPGSDPFDMCDDAQQVPTIESRNTPMPDQVFNPNSTIKSVQEYVVKNHILDAIKPVDRADLNRKYQIAVSTLGFPEGSIMPQDVLNELRKVFGNRVEFTLLPSIPFGFKVTADGLDFDPNQLAVVQGDPNVVVDRHMILILSKYLHGLSDWQDVISAKTKADLVRIAKEETIHAVGVFQQEPYGTKVDDNDIPEAVKYQTTSFPRFSGIMRNGRLEDIQMDPITRELFNKLPKVTQQKLYNSSYDLGKCVTGEGSELRVFAFPNVSDGSGNPMNELEKLIFEYRIDEYIKENSAPIQILPEPTEEGKKRNRTFNRQGQNIF